jgi:hypothetical protein
VSGSCDHRATHREASTTEETAEGFSRSGRLTHKYDGNLHDNQKRRASDDQMQPPMNIVLGLDRSEGYSYTRSIIAGIVHYQCADWSGSHKADVPHRVRGNPWLMITGRRQGCAMQHAAYYRIFLKDQLRIATLRYSLRCISWSWNWLARANNRQFFSPSWRRTRS